MYYKQTFMAARWDGDFRPIQEVLFTDLNVWKVRVGSTDDPSTVTERWAALTWAKWLRRTFKTDIVIYDACGGVV